MPRHFVRIDPAHTAGDSALAVVAARVGRARLIDNGWVRGSELVGYLAPPLTVPNPLVSGTGGNIWNV